MNSSFCSLHNSIDENDQNDRLERPLIALKFDSFSSEQEFVEETKKNSTDFSCQCAKVFLSSYGLLHHTAMNHPNQSILCSQCQTTFRSHRALKSHQQRFHLPMKTNLPDYQHVSSYLVVAFSSTQFPSMCKNACEQKLLPLGELSAKFFACSHCQISFPCSRTLKFHSLEKHQFYEDQLCRTILDEIILEIEKNFENQPDEFQTIQWNLAERAAQFGLVKKETALQRHRLTRQFHREIYPKCEHLGRTCANLCLDYLPSYQRHIRNHQFQIPIIPKGNPFIQGSIVAKVPLHSTTTNDSLPSKDVSITSPKRKSMKRVNSSLSDISTSTQSKKKATNEIQRKTFVVFQSETKSSGVPTSSTSPRKTNQTYTRSLSSGNLPSPRSSKRSRSPTIVLAVERSSQKRRRQREQRKPLIISSPVTLKLDDDIEQENDDDEIISNKTKERQASSGSIEYVHVVNVDSQPTSSLNNVENFQSNGKIEDDEIVICHSKNNPNRSLTKPSQQNKAPDYDENVRVRCKVCGNIIEGRRRFSNHVLTMHSHLLNKGLTKTQQQQQTAIVR